MISREQSSFALGERTRMIAVASEVKGKLVSPMVTVGQRANNEDTRKLFHE